MKVASYNGCKVYNLSSGKTAPHWMSKSKRRAMQKDEEYRRRVELIQDFEMPTASQCITMTRDGEHIIATGVYPPVVKCFTTTDLAMKFQRGLTCDVVAIETLSDDFGKLVFLQSDRTLSFHAPYGKHYSIRVPNFGRHMAYNWDNCDLLVAGNGNQVYRLNLEAGQFREPFELGFEGCNKLHINPSHQLIGCGGERGVCEFWDPRQRQRVASLSTVAHSGGICDVTELKFDTDGLTLGVGTSTGFVHLYDIRSSTPLHTKEHQYGLPIVDITFHQPSRTVISTDKKVIKIWHRNEPDLGKIMTNIETPADINALVVAKDSRGPSGLIFAAGEQSRIMTYFVPQLGAAPRWCSFLESITEELEESVQQSVYEDFKFVTKQELEELGALSLIGTPMLKGYMHGFFLEMKLYNKLRAVSKPFEYEEYRKSKIREKIDAKRQSRISTVKKLPKVNKELAERLMKKAGSGADGEAPALVDDRFKALFEREEFQQDRESQEYLTHHPNARFGGQKKAARPGDSDDEENIYDAIEDDPYHDEDEDDDENDDEDEDGHSDWEEEGGRGRDVAESEDEDEEYARHLKKARRSAPAADQDDVGAIERATVRRKQRQAELRGWQSGHSGGSSSGSGSAGGNKKRMFQLADGFTAADAVFGDAKALRQSRKASSTLAAVPLQDRLRKNATGREARFSHGRGAGRGERRGGGRGRGGKGGRGDRRFARR